MKTETHRATAHNVYCVRFSQHTTRSDAPEQQETLLDKIAVASAFLGCVVLLIFLG